MDFTLSDDQQALRRAVRELCARFSDEYWDEHDAGHTFPREFYDTLAAAGYVGIALPEEYGGAGLGVTEAALMMHEIAASGGGFNACSSIHLSIFGMNSAVKHADEDFKRRYLPRVASGELHIAFGVTEPDAGLETPKIKTSARRDGDTYRVNGRKVWTSKALDADKVVLLVRTTPIERCERRTDGMTLLLADLKAPSVEIRAIPKIGRNAVSSCEVFYDDHPVAVADRIGEEGRGFYYLLDSLNPERILTGAEYVGIGRAALERATRYARERVVFDRPIGQNQAIAHPLAHAWAGLEAAELMLWRAAWRYDRGEPAGADANAAKLLCSEAGYAAADAAMQTLGGFSYAREYAVGRLWIESRLGRIAPVTNEMILNFLAEHVLELPKSY